MVFSAVVVADRELGEDVVVDAPPGQGACGLLDVALGVMADAQAEELHQLARQVLVRVALAVARGVEPDQHRRVVNDSAQQRRERPSAELAEQFVLPAHQRQAADLEVAGCEVVVPQERQPLGQRVGAEQHPVNPPGLEPLGITGGGG